MERRRFYEWLNFDEIMNFLQATARSRRGRLVLTGCAMVVALAIAFSPGWFNSKPAPAANASNGPTVTVDSVPITSPALHVIVPLPTISIDTTPDAGRRIGLPLPTPTTQPKPTTSTAPTTTPTTPAPPPNTAPATAPPATPAPTTPPVTDGPIVTPH